jgi:hypothetical protein
MKPTEALDQGASSRSENEVEYNLEGKVFRSVSNTGNGDVDAETVFHYRQTADIVTADYSGGCIVAGHLIARMLAGGRLDMRYHHLNDKGDFMLGKCLSIPERLPDGRLRFKEEWQWLSGDRSSGYSEIEEVAPSTPLQAP